MDEDLWRVARRAYIDAYNAAEGDVEALAVYWNIRDAVHDEQARRNAARKP